MNTDEQITVGPTRQLSALFYDAWLLAAVFMAASALVLPFTSGEPVKAGNPFMTTYIFVVWYGFYAWFWTHGGQTLGMRAWKIRLVSTTNKPINLMQSLLRFMSGMPAWLLIAASGYFRFAKEPNLTHPLLEALAKLPEGIVLGIGVLLLISGYMKNSWRNKFSSTQVILVEKK